MLKNNRQFKILDLIESEQIETQQELSQRLNSMGFRVTQATVSRDIKYLGLVKIPCGVDKQRYAQQTHNDFTLSKLSEIARGGILEIKMGSDKIFVRASIGYGRLIKQYLSNVLGDEACMMCDDSSVAIFLFDKQQPSIIMEKINKSLNL